MQLSRLKDIISNYLKGKATKAEHQLLDHWLDTIEKNSDVDTHISEEKSKIIRNRILGRISQRTVEKKKRVFFQPWMKVAAAIIPLIAVAGYLAFITFGDAGMLRYTTAIGQYKEIILPDSSKVTLKPGSSLSFSPKFGDTRNVLLEGEAFFNVRRDPARKFTVNAGAVSVQVLGTSFLVKAYKSIQHVSVVVHTGKVQVSDHDKVLGLLMPSDKLVFDKHNSQVKQSKVGLGDPADRRLIFEETALKEILLTLQFHYPVRFSGAIPDTIQLSGTLDTRLSVEQIIGALNSVIEQYNIRISRKDNQQYMVE